MQQAYDRKALHNLFLSALTDCKHEIEMRFLQKKKAEGGITPLNISSRLSSLNQILLRKYFSSFFGKADTWKAVMLA